MHHRIRSGIQAPKWPSYTGTSQYVGTSTNGRVIVFVDPSLGAPALTNAQDLVKDATRISTDNDAFFGTTGGTVNAIVFALGGATDGTGGADHMGCTFQTGQNIEVCASFGNSARVSALFEAELSECSMNNNLCGLSTGEALSRWCAFIVSNNALADFATAPTWAQDGMPDFVTKTDPTDQNADSTGCGMAFLSWLLSKGQAIDAIAPAMVQLGDSGTLAQLYAKLTGDSQTNAWPAFSAAVKALAGGVTSDDPFNGAPRSATLESISARAVETAGRIFSAVLGDVLAGHEEEQIGKRIHSEIGNAGAPHPLRP